MSGIQMADQLLGPEQDEEAEDKPEVAAEAKSAEAEGKPTVEASEEAAKPEVQAAAAEGTEAEAESGDEKPEAEDAAKGNPAVAGIIGNLQDERVKRRTAEAQALANRQRVEALEAQLAALQGSGQPSTAKPAEAAAEAADEGQDLSSLPDDELITIAQAKKALPAMAQTAARQVIQQQRAEESETAALASLTEEKCGKGMDYATVMREGSSFLLPGDRQHIAASRDPAAEAYRLCLERNPILRDRRDESRTAALRDSIVKELQGKQTPQASSKPASKPAASAAAARPLKEAVRKTRQEIMADKLLGPEEEE